MADMQTLADLLIQGDRHGVAALCRAALEEGLSPDRVLSQGLIAGMDVVGKRFRANEIYVPEVLIAARAMKAGIDVLKPCLEAAGIQPRGTVVLGTVKGDLHDIGKNLVGMMLTGGGFRVVDLGTDVSVEKFIEVCCKECAQVCGMSALLTTTMPMMKVITATIKESGLGIKTMIGGAPVTQDYANSIGADAYAPDAASAVDAVRTLLNVA